MRHHELFEMLTSDMRIFLKGYSPKERHFTSLEEIRLVEDKLNIESYKDRLIVLRNAVVQFYNDLIEEHTNDKSMIYEYMESMMSVTAVIDNYKYKY